MEINLTFERPEEGPKSGPVTIGWFLTQDKGAVMFDPPERVLFRQTNKAHAKSASRCPAVIQLESRYFMVKCPFDIHLGFGRDDKGKPHLINRAGAASPIRANKLGEVMTLVSEPMDYRIAPPCRCVALPLIADELAPSPLPPSRYRREQLPTQSLVASR